MERIARALLSVSDKTGLVDFARGLAARGVELVSTGGTAKALREAGLKVVDVAEITQSPEMMDGRVKTLHPKIHGGLLAVRGKASHEQAMKDHAIPKIDLLVVNLYPFENAAASGADFALCVENIDIGGPALIRAGAKNHASVTVVVEPADYLRVLDEMEKNGGATTLELRKELGSDQRTPIAKQLVRVGARLQRQRAVERIPWFHRLQLNHLDGGSPARRPDHRRHLHRIQDGAHAPLTALALHRSQHAG